jgi:4-hydroxy-4-methyl-2-oxoglutarate aldolase
VKNIIEAFKALDTASVSDALDRLGIPAGCLNIKSVTQGVRAVGPAFTVRYRVIGEVERGTVGDFLDDVPVGSIVVIDNAGRTDCTVWGDIMTSLASQKGIAGTVIDGVCRDVPKIRALGYPIFTLGYFMMTGKDRVEVDTINQPVSIGGRQVRPGDIMVTDDSGVVVVPISRAEEVLVIAQEIELSEQRILQLIADGKSLREARTLTKYHSLQTPSAIEAKL